MRLVNRGLHAHSRSLQRGPEAVFGEQGTHERVAIFGDNVILDLNSKTSNLPWQIPVPPYLSKFY